MPAEPKQRLDKLLVERGLVPSRERAASLILAGRVLVDQQKQTKAGASVSTSSDLRLLGEEMPYVSRGGLKLAGALDHWHLDLTGLLCIDIGASTGGFTDCMLQRGATGVLAVDTGYGQLAQKLRSDPRVHLLERTNARLLAPASLHAQSRKLWPATPPAFFSMDVSFIGASLVLPPVLAALAPAPAATWQGQCVVLVKPQFEAGREWVGKGGIVRDVRGHQVALERVRVTLQQLGAQDIDHIESPITGAEGNHEFLMTAHF